MNPSQLVDVVFKSIQQGTIEERRCKMKRQIFGSSIGSPEARNWTGEPLVGKDQCLTVRRRNRGNRVPSAKAENNSKRLEHLVQKKVRNPLNEDQGLPWT